MTSDPLRIAYLTSAYGRPSDTFIRNEVRGLRQLGHVVSTFSIRRPDADATASDHVKEEQARTRYLVEQGTLRLLAALFRQLVFNPANSFRAMRAAWRLSPPGISNHLMHGVYLIEAALLAEFLRQDNIQILHNHIGENSASVALLAAEFSGVPFSMTIHGPGVFFRPEKWSLAEKIERSAFTAVITNFCRSQCMIFAAPATWDRLHIIHCTVQPDFLADSTTIFDQSDSTHESTKARFVCVGRLCPEKGQLLLVRAAKGLIEKGRELAIVLIGDGPSRATIEEEIHTHGLEEHVQLLGWRDSDDVRKEVTSSTALVLPSFAEGLPVVIMEALALGRPVVTTRIAGIPELVETGKTGWLISPGSQAELTEALDNAIDTDEAELQRMGEEGKRRIREQHNPDIEIARLAELFRAHVK